jgi:hypothetical protein
MSKQVEIVIDENGDVHIDTLGFHGKDCENIHETLTKALGQLVEQEDKPEKAEKAIITSKDKQFLEY